MVLEPSFLQPRFHSSSRVSVFETPSLQSRAITLLAVSIDRSEADGSIAANITVFVHIIRLHAPLVARQAATWILNL